MIEADPGTYFTTSHHRAYPWVLARIAKLDAAVLPDLLRMGLRFAKEKKRKTTHS